MQAVEDILGISIINLVSFAVAILVVLIIFAIYNATLVKDPMRGRLKALEERREALRAGLMTQRKRTSPIKKVDAVGIMRTIADKFKLLQTEQSQKVTDHLVQAGYRSKDAVVVYQVMRLISPIIVGGLAITYIYGMNMMPDKPYMQLLASIGSVLFGAKLPDIMVTNQKTKRADLIRKGMPDSLDLLVVCAEAGLTLDSALKRVAKEMVGACPELAEELELASIELGFLPERRQALINLASRVDLPALRNVVTTLIQSEKYGTPLAGSLRVLSAEFRNERLLRAEEKAARLPAILTVPLILFILPTLFVVLMGPAACSVSDNFLNAK